MDYNLTLQETGQVQGVKAVCICQAKFVTAAAGLRGISHLSPRWVEADLIADSCPTFFQRSIKGLSVWIMSNFTSTYCFSESYTYTTSYSALARQPARKKRGHECRSGVDFPISQRYFKKSIFDIWTLAVYTHPRWAFRGNSNTGQ